MKRGSLTIWIDEAVSESWYDEGPVQRGGQYVYSEECIKCILTLKCVFGLAYRQTQGFVRSILRLMDLDLSVPSYTQLCRRAQEITLDLVGQKSGGLYLVVDSTGLKVYGEGEWKVRQHGYSKRRTWRKLHLGVDENTGLIYASKLTENSADDAAQVEDLEPPQKVPPFAVPRPTPTGF